MSIVKKPNYFPVFHHIAKCAGTYTLSWMQMFCRRYHILKGDNQKPGWTSLRTRRCQINLGNTHHLTVCFYTPTDIHSKDDSFTSIMNDRHADYVDLETFISYVKTGDIIPFAVSIDPAAPGVSSANNLIGQILNITNRKRFDFAILRNPYDKAVSLFSYLSSDRSKHEPTHNAIIYDQLSDYLRSYQLEDSWLIRDLMNMTDNQEITQNHYDKCINIMSNWVIGDIKETDNIINKVFEKCYGIVMSDVESHVVDVWKNDTPNKIKKSFNDLDDKTVEKFLNRTYWDRKLWKEFCK